VASSDEQLRAALERRSIRVTSAKSTCSRRVFPSSADRCDRGHAVSGGERARPPASRALPRARAHQASCGCDSKRDATNSF
jgi:hypothetical protein